MFVKIEYYTGRDAVWGGRIRTDFSDAHRDFKGELLPDRSTEHSIMAIPTEGRACADLRMGICEC